jgi:hypothetical protein
MSVISLGGTSELVLLGLVERAEPYYTLKLNACQRLIVGWNLEYCQYKQGQGPGKKGAGFWPTGPISIDSSVSSGTAESLSVFV